MPLPTYMPFTAIEYDFPATAAGVDPGLVAYPSESSLVSAAPDGIGQGATITTMAKGQSQLLGSVSKNRFWQELNKRLGATLKFNYPGRATDYANKLATTLAGGDLPDFVELTPAPPHLPDVLQKDFQDLSEHLAGDAVKKYPNLANIPTAAWRGTTFNNAIFALPRPISLSGYTVILRDDIRKKVGAPDEVNSGADFLSLCKALTDVKENRWAVTQPLALLTYVQQMCGAPNQWQVANGKFSSANESEGTRQALDIVAQMWKDGVVFPDAFVNTTAPYTLAGAGKVAMMYGGVAQWLASIRDFRSSVPQFNMVGMVLPKWDGGGQSQQYLGPGYASIMGIKKTTPDRVKTLLAVANWIASPYGTTQKDFLLFGIDGWDSKTSDGVRGLTDTGIQEINPLDVTVIAAPPQVLFKPGTHASDIKAAHDWEEAVIPTGLPIPTVGLSSDTDQNKGASLAKALQDVQADVIQGRKKLSDWDAAVVTWKKNGGDQMAREYEESYAASR